MTKKIDGRWIVVLLACLYAAFVTQRISTRGWLTGWAAVRIPAMEPPMVDMRAVLSGLDRYRAGVPVAEIQSPPRTPDAPLPLAYPASWMLFSYLGLGENETTACVAVLAIACAVATLWFIGPLTWKTGLLYSLVLLSPSLMLAVERGNADLLIFLLAIGGCALLAQAPEWAAAAGLGLFLAAAVLKLYPVAAFVAALKRRRGWVLVAVAAALFALFVIVDQTDLARVSQVAPRTTYLSFGSRMGLDRVARSFAFAASSALTLAAVAAAYWASPRRPELSLEPGIYGFGFLAGTSMFLLCFAIGNNFAYRFGLLLLAMPQLLRWAPSRISPRVALAILSCSVWTTATPRLSPFSALLNWLLFFLIATLFFRTLPEFSPKPAQRTALYSN